MLASDTLSNVKFVQEKKLISKFFDEISQDTGKYGFGVNETLQLMEMGAVETLVVWENLEVDRCILKNSGSGDEVIKFLNKEAQQKSETYRCGPALPPLSNQMQSKTQICVCMCVRRSLACWKGLL